MAELYSRPIRNDGSLASYYRLEGNSTDYKAANNGTDTGITYSNANGLFGQGAGFILASSSKIALGTTGIPTGTANRTWCGWIYKTTTSVDVMMGSGNGNALDTFGVYINNLLVTAWGGGDTSTGISIALNSWNFIATTYDGANVQVFVNDNAVYSAAKTLNTSNLNAGFGANIAAATNFLTGRLDDMAIFSRVLTATEISQLYLGRGFVGSRGLRPHPFSPGLAR